MMLLVKRCNRRRLFDQQQRMKKSRQFGFLGVLFILSGAISCTSIKPYFPDKQKDYRYSQEISELRLPADLAEQKVTVSEKKVDFPEKSEPQDFSKELDQDKKYRQSQIGGKRGRVELVGFDGGALRLIVYEPLKRTWYIVGKALSREAVEVTERNQAAASYTIQFDPDKKEIEDGSLWNEFEFFFGEDKHQDQKFHIILAEDGPRTEVVVTDEQGNPQSEGVGLGVLFMLFETIKKDLTQGK